MVYEDIAPEGAFPPQPVQFHVAEFQAIHAEINAKINNIEANVRFLMGGIAALWSWLLAGNWLGGLAMTPLLYLPLLFTILFGLVIWRQMRFVSVRGEYLSEVEREYGAPHLGWERFFAVNYRSSEWFIHKLAIIILVAIQTVLIGWTVQGTLHAVFAVWLPKLLSGG